jgi:hypothetical protein
MWFEAVSMMRLKRSAHGRVPTSSEQVSSSKKEQVENVLDCGRTIYQTLRELGSFGPILSRNREQAGGIGEYRRRDIGDDLKKREDPLSLEAHPSESGTARMQLTTWFG